MANVYCENCGYRFSIKPGKPLPKRCSYCSSEGTFKRVKSAQDLLDEVEVKEEDEK
jgi:biotin synthase-like enzyme